MSLYEEYHPYGTSSYRSWKSGVEVSAKRYRYTGKERDEETSLYYHGARYYAPWLGRWMSADPAGTVDGSNLFAYVRGSPVVLSDPSGTQGSVHGWTTDFSYAHAEPSADAPPRVAGPPPVRHPAPKPTRSGGGSANVAADVPVTTPGSVGGGPVGTPAGGLGVSSLGQGGGTSVAPTAGGGGGPGSAGAGGGGQGTDPAYEAYRKHTAGPPSAERQGVANIAIGGSTLATGALLLAPETDGASLLVPLILSGQIAGGAVTLGVGVADVVGGATGDVTPEEAARAQEGVAVINVITNPGGAAGYTGTLVATGDPETALQVGGGAAALTDLYSIVRRPRSAHRTPGEAEPVTLAELEERLARLTREKGAAARTLKDLRSEARQAAHRGEFAAAKELRDQIVEAQTALDEAEVAATLARDSVIEMRLRRKRGD